MKEETADEKFVRLFDDFIDYRSTVNDLKELEGIIKMNSKASKITWHEWAKLLDICCRNNVFPDIEIWGPIIIEHLKGKANAKLEIINNKLKLIPFK